MLGHAMAATWRDARARVAATRGAGAAGGRPLIDAPKPEAFACAEEEDEFHHADKSTESLLHFKCARRGRRRPWPAAAAARVAGAPRPAPARAPRTPPPTPPPSHAPAAAGSPPRSASCAPPCSALAPSPGGSAPAATPSPRRSRSALCPRSTRRVGAQGPWGGEGGRPSLRKPNGAPPAPTPHRQPGPPTAAARPHARPPARPPTPQNPLLPAPQCAGTTFWWRCCWRPCWRCQTPTVRGRRLANRRARAAGKPAGKPAGKSCSLGAASRWAAMPLRLPRLPLPASDASQARPDPPT
jgi:hypothetical protein